MNSRTWCRCFGWVCLSFLCVASAARADEIWVAPTYQTDLGGVGIGSNGLWPVSVVGASRFAWAIPNNLLAFSSARVALIPHAPGGAATLNIFICSAENADVVTASCAGPFAHAFHGVPNQLLEVDISAAVGSRIGVAGQTYLSVLAYSTPSTATDHIVGLRFVYDAAIPNGVATLDANTFTGAQTAPAFVGNGSGLTNVSATLLDGLDSTAFATGVHGHNVSQVSNAARLAGGNSFIGTQRIDAGNLDMPVSTAGAGSITKDGVSFLHDFGALNTFVGRNAGNFSLSGTSNTAIGASTLQSNSDGSNNTAIGLNALQLNTTGDHNTAIGVVALTSNTDGQENTAVGAAALATNSSGIRNIAVGVGAGNLLITGSNNIYIGASSGGANESNTTYLGKAGTQTKTFIAGIRGITTLNANAVPVMIDSAGQLGTISSSRRFKEDIHDMPASLADRLLQLRPVTFRYARPFADGSKPTQYGLVAEEVAEVFAELAVRDANGVAETVHYETLNVLLLKQVQEQRAALVQQQKDNERQQHEIEQLKRQMAEFISRP